MAALKEQTLIHAAPFMKEIEVLTSVKGVSVPIAITIITDIIEANQSLNHMLSASPTLRTRYDCLAQYKKGGLVRTGLRRRVFAEIYHILKKQEFHYGRDAAKHQTKMDTYRRFLIRHTILLSAQKFGLVFIIDEAWKGNLVMAKKVVIKKKSEVQSRI